MARTVFRQAPIIKIAPLTWQAYYAQHATQPTAHVCPVCGKAIGHVRHIAPHHDPTRPRPFGDQHV